MNLDPRKGTAGGAVDYSGVPAQHLLLHDVDWQAYVAIGEALGERPALRMTYDRGDLEFMTTSREHELYKTRLARLIETLTEELNIPIEMGGNMTFRRPESERALEPDECFWIAHEAQMRARLEWDPAHDPPPDLVLEIEVSRSALNRMTILAALGVPEVWRCNGETIHVHRLQADQTYQAVEGSLIFPGLPIQGIVPFLQLSATEDNLTRVRAFRAWVREQLARQTP